MEFDREDKREDKRGIFLGIVGVLTLIVAIVGASFAYFSVNAKSTDNAVTVTAASVQIVFEDGNIIEANQLIPSSQAIALETQRRALAGEKYDNGEGVQVPYEICKDDKGYTVCGTYDFSLTNGGASSVDIKAYIEPTTEGIDRRFTNLKYILYNITDVTESTPADQKNGTQIHTGNMSYERFGIIGNSLDDTVTILGNGTTNKYRLFFWLNEAGGPQDEEQGATFMGTIHVELVGAGSGITGNADRTMG